MEFEITYAYYLNITPDRTEEYWRPGSMRLAARYRSSREVIPEWDYDQYVQDTLDKYNSNPGYRNVRLEKDIIHYEYDDKKKYKNIDSLEELIAHLSDSTYDYSIIPHRDGRPPSIVLNDCS